MKKIILTIIALVSIAFAGSVLAMGSAFAASTKMQIGTLRNTGTAGTEAIGVLDQVLIIFTIGDWNGNEGNWHLG